MRRGRRIAFNHIADAARSSADAIVTRWLPDGRREGREWVARNPSGRTAGQAPSRSISHRTLG